MISPGLVMIVVFVSLLLIHVPVISISKTHEGRLT